MNLSDAQIRALDLCRGRGLTERSAAVLGIDKRLLNSLSDAKFIRYRTLARDPTWVITKNGREALKK